jgi:ketosteroid isomerase-like protein
MRLNYLSAPLAAALALGVAMPIQAQESVSYAEASRATAEVADAYFEAYIGRDWDSLESLLDENASFHDESAELVFGGLLTEGKTAMMDRFRVGYAAITHMRFATQRVIHSGAIAIYEGDLDWGLDLGDGTLVSSVTPMVVILRVDGGKVVRHRDHVDYAPFVAAVRAAQ